MHHQSTPPPKSADYPCAADVLRDGLATLQAAGINLGGPLAVRSNKPASPKPVPQAQDAPSPRPTSEQSVGAQAVAAWKDFEARRVAPYMARIKSSGLPAETVAHLLRQPSGMIEATLARIEAGGAK